MNSIKLCVKFLIEAKRFEWCEIREIVSEAITDRKIMKNVITGIAWSICQVLWLVAIPFIAIWYTTADSEKKRNYLTHIIDAVDEAENEYGAVCNLEEEP